MHCFVTGATGFIGRWLVRKLLEREGSVVHFLVRPESEAKLVELLDVGRAGLARRARGGRCHGAIRWACAWATCWTSSARRRTRPG